MGGNDDMVTDRRLPWATCLNVRDLGGIPGNGGNMTCPGAFVRMDNPARLTAEGAEALVRYGIRTIVDLRTSFERTIDPPPFAPDGRFAGRLDSIHAPFFDDGEWETSTAAAQTGTAAMYIHMLENFQPRIAVILTALSLAQCGGVAFHCHSGKDRTGLVAALLLSLAGVSPDAIAADYALSSGNLTTETDRWIEHGPGTREEREQEIERHLSRIEVMPEVLEYLERTYGGVPAYLARIGLPDGDMDALQRRLLEVLPDAPYRGA